jgi:fructose-bisphosphate aldolase class 1
VQEYPIDLRGVVDDYEPLTGGESDAEAHAKLRAVVEHKELPWVPC